MGEVLYIAHRGSAALYPEETAVAYNNSLADGITAIEADVQTLSDGALGLMHDSTVDRTTTSTGNVSALDTADFLALSIDSNTVMGGNYGDALPPLLAQAFIDAYKDKATLVLEDKDGESMAALLLMLRLAGARRGQVMLSSFALADLAIATAAGYETMLLVSDTNGATTDLSSAVSAGVNWVGLPSTATDSNVTSWAASMSVAMYTINRRHLRDAKIALGVKAFFSDDPLYLASRAPLHGRDVFSWGTWAPGMLEYQTDAGTTLANRGKFFSSDYWGYDSTSGSYLGVLMGYLCPLRNPSSFVLDLKITFNSTDAGGDTRWASLWIGTSDQRFVDGATDTNTGYHILFRKNGTIGIYKKAPGGAASLLQAIAGTTISADAEATYRVTVTATQITAARTDVATTNTVTDSTYRGGYLQLGRTGLACKFRDLVVS